MDVLLCTLGLGPTYARLASQFAADVAKLIPGERVLVATDCPEALASQGGAIVVRRERQGRGPYHEKRFALEAALARASTAIFVDADTRVLRPFSMPTNWSAGFTERPGSHESMLRHLEREPANRLPLVASAANELGVDIEATEWLGESLFAVTADAGREQEFLREWGYLAGYFEAHGLCSGEGLAMGLAAARVGWRVNEEPLPVLQAALTHLNASAR